MLTGQKEWIAIGALIVYIAFVPCPQSMKEFFSSSVGKVVALAAVIYTWKYISEAVAILLLVAVLRSGSLREYLDESGMTPPAAPTTSASSTDYKCPDEFTYMMEKKACMKGNESKPPICNDSSMIWDSTVGACITSGTNSGPPGGSTPGAMAARNEIANSMPPTVAKEPFTPYGGKDKQEFAPL
jgi:hypothetical protein